MRSMATRRSAWLGAVLAASALLALAGGISAQQPGAIDTSFGTNGFAGVDCPYGPLQAMAVDSSGRIVAVGGSGSQWAVLRFLANGTLDTTFNAPAFPGYSAWDVAVKGSRIVVVGQYGTTGRLTVVCLTDSGGVDTSFSGDGIAQVAIDLFAVSTAVEIQPDNSPRRHFAN